jgi:heme iron utilization protein
MVEGSGRQLAWQARKLLRGARAGTLATVVEGQPFASLVTPACAPDLSVLMLLSGLSEHTRHLRAEPRCALLVAGPAETSNPQTAPRLSVTGIAETVVDSELKARWLALHPYAAMYADFADFSLWRVALGGGLMVGGFGRALRLRIADLRPDPLAVAAVAAAEPEMISAWNAAPAALGALVASAGGEPEGDPWRMAAIDVDGCDLARGERVLRIDWSQPVADAGGVERELARLTGLAQSN